MLCDLRRFVRNEADAREKLAQFASKHASVDEIDLSRWVSVGLQSLVKKKFIEIRDPEMLWQL